MKYVMADISAVEIQVLFFAKARELCGKKESQLLIPSATSYDNLLDEIVQKFSLEPIRDNLILAINEEYATSESEVHLKEGDQVAVIPPLSGVD
ncbi:molybdopterin synthase sulfur carrier subunit [Zootermopsis nevadensis]|uniref:molybdopterin synthase sulfur carrier subunit n=1 Tax=Zootermopsis nevadensis TaxID=136037 RepID=UPI000B8E8A52|nr:molybdopterin synthase sulfur carrier subunit [Zootermopsis nevadensis]